MIRNSSLTSVSPSSNHSEYCRNKYKSKEPTVKNKGNCGFLVFQATYTKYTEKHLWFLKMQLEIFTLLLHFVLVLVIALLYTRISKEEGEWISTTSLFVATGCYGDV
ncbi:unnamed protein product [Vicia faba]|uniref:Uncharacterized protein n=1 Tax=Vicia faba TaxID=3906 RepID=A0AAV0YWN1_VICFA|nr:unnamed protein product [Vicia faba]